MEDFKEIVLIQERHNGIKEYSHFWRYSQFVSYMTENCDNNVKYTKFDMETFFSTFVNYLELDGIQNLWAVFEKEYNHIKNYNKVREWLNLYDEVIFYNNAFISPIDFNLDEWLIDAINYDYKKATLLLGVNEIDEYLIEGNYLPNTILEMCDYNVKENDYA